MPTISTEGTPASSGSFETREEVSSEISIPQVEAESIQNLHSGQASSDLDLDLEGLKDSNSKMAAFGELSSSADMENVKATLSQLERVEVSQKLEQISTTEQLLDEEVFHSLEDARDEPMYAEEKNRTNKFDDMTFREEDDLPKVMPIEETENEEQQQWVDVIGSGDIMKKVVVKGLTHTRPHRGQIVTVNLKGQLEGDLEVESLEDFSFTLGDAEVVQGLELAIPLMDKKEIADILVKSRFAYGELGREPDIPSDATIQYTIELLDVYDEPSIESLTIAERMRIGSGKKDRGNFWFTRSDFSQAIVCYRRALEFLDDENNTFSDPPELLQQMLEDRLKVYNNLALAQLKVDAFDAAIISVDTVLRIQPNNVKALFRKGKILAAQGNTDEAIVCMRKALKLEPDTKIIHAELARLQSQKSQENASERELYRKMLGEQRHLVRAKRSSKFKVWGSLLGGIAAVVLGIVAYRQYHADGKDLHFILTSSYFEMLKEKMMMMFNAVAAKLEQEQVEQTIVPQTVTVEAPTM